MWKTRLGALCILLTAGALAYGIYLSEPTLHQDPEAARASVFAQKFPLKKGLDLSGGVELVYQAHVTSIESARVAEAMESLRDVVERRINLFGVSEPLVQVETRGGITSDVDYRLIVELPGVADVAQAVAMIGQTPTLEFMTERNEEGMRKYQDAIAAFEEGQKNGEFIISQELIDGPYEPTALNGRFIERADLEFDPTTRQPIVSITFNKEGSDLFAQITKENIGRTIAIYLDRDLGNFEPISAPVVREQILGGKAQISGMFTPEEARTLVGRLNSGALPVDKLELLSTQTISAPLGAEALKAGVLAGLWGILVVALFLMLWYRLPGVVATLALAVYIILMIAIFKLLGVTLTAAGIAGFILSIGMAIDSNILIFERTKEELRKGHTVHEAVREGFARAWTSIRDSNISSIITAIILFWFGTSLVKGFALIFGLGVVVSLFSAITVTRIFLYSVPVHGRNVFVRALFSSGFFKLY